MNVFYPSSKVGPVMAPAPDQETPTTSEPVWLLEGDAYCVIDGALLYSPRFVDGSYDNLGWAEVDFGAVEEDLPHGPALVETLSKVHYDLVLIKEQGRVDFHRAA